jgi:hypothetical protein
MCILPLFRSTVQREYNTEDGSEAGSEVKHFMLLLLYFWPEIQRCNLSVNLPTTEKGQETQCITIIKYSIHAGMYVVDKHNSKQVLRDADFLNHRTHTCIRRIFTGLFIETSGSEYPYKLYGH